MDTLVDFVKQMESWPVSLLVVVALNFVGWAIKRDDVIPSRFIPTILMGSGSLIYIFVGAPGSIHPEQPHPEIVLALYGMILGVLAWIAHGLIFKRILKLMPNGDDTEVISKPKDKDK